MRATRMISTVVGILVISGFVVSTIYGETVITVDDSGGANYTSIQDAVNNANGGATILVHTGTYMENVNVTKQLIIRSESGNPDGTIVLAADPDNHVFHVMADNVTIGGFGVTGSNNHGIYLEEVEGCVVANNIVSNNRYGIGMENSDHNDLSGNTANANEREGIILRHSRYNTLSNNNVFKNKVGINVLHSSQYNEVSNNTASNNSVGIEQALSDNNNLMGNVISKNRYGIFLYKCNSNEITGNTLLSNSDCGIHIRYSDDNDLMGNTIRSSRLGIHLSDYSRNNTAKDNFLLKNGEDLSIAADSGNHTRNDEMVEFTIGSHHEGAMDDFDLLENLKEKQNIPLEEYTNRESASYLPDVIATYGKLPEIETEEDCYRWFYEAAPAIMHGSRARMDPYLTDGVLVSYGPDVDGYIEVIIYENLTIETHPIMDEIYEIIYCEAKKIGISDVPVVFFEGEFVRTDPLILVEGSNGMTSQDNRALGESTPGFGLRGGLISFFGGWLFQKNRGQRR
ncbi:MAG: Cell surface glycoprotein [Candidatus Methanogaster sp.]|nr:MAG: Cell surface glycoprotein [ANME-2 cluster archaeon]